MEPTRNGVMNMGDGCRSVFDLDKEQVSKFQLQSFEGTSKLGKRKAINGRIDSSCSLLKNYTNLRKSHPPKRILFHENGEWNDFPQGLVELVREDFLMKKAVIKVRFHDIDVMLDLLYMVQVELITGSPKPIAWIDEAGSCYFPELSSLNGQVHRLCQNRLDRMAVYGESELNQAHEVKLRIEIDVNEPNNPNLEECVEESNVGSKRVKVEQESFGDVDEFLGKGKIMPKTDVKPQNFVGNNHTQLELAYQCLDTVGIRNLFHLAMMPLNNVCVQKIDKVDSNKLQMRYELFQKQVEIIDKYRGNSNVRYAWFPCSRDAISSITNYGLWHGGEERSIKYGNGVHLNAVNSAYQSASYCNVDDKGLHQMVFCRVILGNMEVLESGSQQFHPSCEKFDSGVDDLENPSCYIIWNMNASTHIFPEYVITFKMPSVAEGSKVPEKNKLDISRAGQDPQGQLQVQAVDSSLEKIPLSKHQGRSHQYQSSQKGAPDTVASCAKSPKPPSMHFVLLFKALEDKISAKDMHIIRTHYDQFKQMKISRDEFIIKLRLIAGDELLRSTITNMP